MVAAALHIPSWVFLVLIIVFIISAFSDSIPGLFCVIGIVAVVALGFFVQAAGEGLHDVFGWPTDHLIKADNPLGDSEVSQQEPFYEPEEEPEVEYR